MDYRKFVGDSKISELYRMGNRLSDKHIVHITSSYYGGGIASSLRSLIPLMNDLGIDVGWRAMVGSPDFFRVSRKFYNALHGEEVNLTEMKKLVFERANEDYSKFTHLPHDLVIVHNHQSLPLISCYKKDQPWIWRVHFNLSSPDSEVWEYMRRFTIPYYRYVFSMEEFLGGDFSDSYDIIEPSVDPLTTKNRELRGKKVRELLSEGGVDPSRPIVSQVSRFDRRNDPEGVLEGFKRIKEERGDCQLILAGEMATHDPEGQAVFNRVERKAEEMRDVTIIVNGHDLVVNALQRGSDVVLQKSLKEGFGLSVSEALWKETPVVGSSVGGITTQIVDGDNGYLVNPQDYDEVAERTLEILSDENLRREMGRRGRERVEERFLITRHIEDWLDVWMKVLH